MLVSAAPGWEFDDLDMVVMRTLAKSPDDRYQSADEMEADLDRVADLDLMS